MILRITPMEITAAGEEKDLATEKKIFGKDFAYIRDISNFSKIVGRYLIKQLDSDE